MNEPLEKRIEKIEVRNARVELDKAWEVSWTRKVSIAVLTYIVVVSYLITIDNDKPFINGAVPVVGFLLSTLVLKRIRNIWQGNNK
jgi:hypothetical protein